MSVPYCPGQVPMGTHSSSVKIWSWAVTQRTWLNGSTIPMQGPTLEVSCHGTKSTCIVGLSTIRGQPDSGESFIVLQSGPTRSLVAKFPQHSVVACRTRISCCSLRCERVHGRVCANLWCLMSWRPKCIRTKAAMWAQRTYIKIYYVRIKHGGQLPREPWKTTKLSKLGVGTYLPRTMCICDMWLCTCKQAREVKWCLNSVVGGDSAECAH